MRPARLALYVTLSLLMTLPVYGANTMDVYNAYGVSYNSSLSENVSQTLQMVEDEKRNLVKYNNIQNLHRPKLDMKGSKEELQALSDNLMQQGQLSYEDAISAEAQYLQALQDYTKLEERAHRKYKVHSPSTNTVSLDEYRKALKDYDDYKQSQNLGAVSMNVTPVKNPHSVKHMKEVTIFKVYEPTQVLAPYNGRISSVSGNTIDIELPDNIRIRLKGVDQQIVKEGDEVKQNQVIGSLRNLELYAGIEINGTRYNLQRVMEGNK